jgi:hypothetical protein
MYAAPDANEAVAFATNVWSSSLWAQRQPQGDLNMTPTFGCVLTPAMIGPLASPSGLRVLAQRAEALGFASVWVPDHVVVPRQVA